MRRFIASRAPPSDLDLSGLGRKAGTGISFPLKARGAHNTPKRQRWSTSGPLNKRVSGRPSCTAFWWRGKIKNPARSARGPASLRPLRVSRGHIKRAESAVARRLGLIDRVVHRSCGIFGARDGSEASQRDENPRSSPRLTGRRAGAARPTNTDPPPHHDSQLRDPPRPKSARHHAPLVDKHPPHADFCDRIVVRSLPSRMVFVFAMFAPASSRSSTKRAIKSSPKHAAAARPKLDRQLHAVAVLDELVGPLLPHVVIALADFVGHLDFFDFIGFRLFGLLLLLLVLLVSQFAVVHDLADRAGRSSRRSSLGRRLLLLRSLQASSLVMIPNTSSSASPRSTTTLSNGWMIFSFSGGKITCSRFCAPPERPRLCDVCWHSAALGSRASRLGS